jgi:hypothetical protein
MSRLLEPPDDGATPDRMWPLDACIVGLTGLVMLLITSKLSFDDSRLLYNGWTYVIAVPLFAVATDLMLRRIASQYVQKSLQIGFLVSVSLHLTLLMLATGVLIFTQYNPKNFMGVTPERSPVSRTVPEYIFETAQKNQAQPDWSKPTDSETASPVVPREQRKLPPLNDSASKLEMPRPPSPIRSLDQQHLTRRDVPTDSEPVPSDSPAKLTRNLDALHSPALSDAANPVAPATPAQADREVAPLERSPDSSTRKQSASMSLKTITNALLAPTKMPELVRQPESLKRPLAGLRRNDMSLPAAGNFGMVRSEASKAVSRRSEMPAGASPAPRSVVVAKQTETSDRTIAPISLVPSKRSKTTGVQIVAGDMPGASSLPEIEPDLAGAKATRNELAAASGMPSIDAGDAVKRPGRSSDDYFEPDMNPVGIPDLNAATIQAMPRKTSVKTDDGAMPAIDVADSMSRPKRRSGAESTVQPPVDFSSMLDLAPPGSAGLADIAGTRAGVIPSDRQPKITSLDLAVGSRPRRDVGGPVTPFGSKPASVESFDRRIRRTQGGQAPTPAGKVGPATEKAIERGLAYLDSVQNADGSWSLQGQGEQVILQSDTAATGLCLLAFQGAGYTHRQHQYADTVAKGLQFLIDNQRTNGDLYRRENRTSDGNVAFYSHGIAALAMSEAYGMTQDPELKEPAQLALDYISATQHRTRGGWRYTPQVSADTSVTGWMMMALKSGELSGLKVQPKTYRGIERWLSVAQSPDRRDRYRYDPYAPNTPSQRHGAKPTPTMTSVGMLMRMYAGWRRDTPEMQSAADYLLQYPPKMGTERSPQRDAYYWYYATQVMFHMGGKYWDRWNRNLNPVLLDSQIDDGPQVGSWDPALPVRDRWSVHAGRLYVTTMNLLNLEVYYRHLPIYEETAD